MVVRATITLSDKATEVIKIMGAFALFMFLQKWPKEGRLAFAMRVRVARSRNGCGQPGRRFISRMRIDCSKVLRAELRWMRMAARAAVPSRRSSARNISRCS
jgi:hypothetical protein